MDTKKPLDPRLGTLVLLTAKTAYSIQIASRNHFQRQESYLNKLQETGPIVSWHNKQVGMFFKVSRYLKTFILKNFMGGQQYMKLKLVT